MGPITVSSLPSAVFQAAFDYARRQPPFSVDLRSVYRTSDYIGAKGTNARDAVLWAQREFPDSSFDIRDGDIERTLKDVYERFGRARDECPGVVGYLEGCEYVGFQRYTFFRKDRDAALELSMDYVFVNPDRRGCGFRDRMQACLFGAALLLAAQWERSVTLSFRQVKNPNNVQRYLSAGFEEVPEIPEADDDDEAQPFAYLSPVSHRPQAPSSYQKVYFSTGLRTFLNL